MYEVDRMVTLIKPTEKFLDWTNATAEKNDDKLTLEELQQDCTVLLIPLFEDTVDAVQYIEEHYKMLFENELESWCIDKSLWPKTRDYRTFCEWFQIEIHSMLYDMVDEEEEQREEFAPTTIQ